MKNVLIVVDYQKDFVDGALPVPEAATIKDFIQDQINSDKYDCIVYTMDTHDKDIYKTSEEATMFPEHCDIDTAGWDLFELKTNYDNLMNQVKFYKRSFVHVGFKEKVFIKDKFSIWEGNEEYLLWCMDNFNEDTNIFICGVATNYCVAANALGYEKLPYKLNSINIFKEGTKGILDNTYQNTIENMQLKNINFI